MISSRRNPLVKRLRSLSSRAGRGEEGLLLLEGTHLLQELVRLKLQPAELIATERWYQRHTQLLVGVNQAIPRRLVTDEVLTAALSTVTPDGVASLCPLNALPEPPTEAHFLLVLDRIQDPGNLGTLLRTALAADVQNVWLGSGVDPLGSKSLRASAGALLQLPHHRFGPDEDTAISQLTYELKRLAAGGMQVVATLVPGSQVPIPPVPYWELNWRLPTALVLGTEGGGLYPELLACCTHAVTLPHSSRVESLNVAAAAVPLLLERRRATMTATTQQSG
ncbi:RNA methyltransferase [Synechococcus sp. A15-24]|uniref:TrmH family RNA methyltransferase n=1 Tax=Synechococcus sp. A15-24 TaxID=1050635 RepID=UPI001647F97D|nr:RNA methyltransferase [Synechococcus sp. A15-24]QNJ29451.1 RNA methyltransferase/ TrmH family [Synechococcus sp. A15-24]